MMRIELGLQQHAIQRNEKGELRIIHGWGDHKTYCVGSFLDPDGASRDGLTSNAFWVISGMYRGDQGMKEAILETFDRLDSRYGMKTFEPYFPANTPGVGRIYKLPPGTAENGAAYIHATAFGIMALFMMGEAKRAWEQLMKIFPFTHKQVSCSPYIMPNSYGDNELLNIAGESMQDWQTGSSNVVLKILIRFVFGFQPEYQGFYIQPAAWLPFDDYQMDIVYQKSSLHIRYTNRQTGRRSFKINNRQCNPVYDEAMGIDKLWIDMQDQCDDIDIVIED
jgi:cellobiose phosphorylase